MGRADQLLKYMLELEAPIATHDAVSFKRAPEIATTELTPDGLLFTNTPELLSELPAPWCLLQREAVVDGKMPGDHLDPLAIERCLWRRQSRQVQRLEKEDADPAPADCAAWIVAPHRPEWLDAWQRKGWVQLREVGAGCTTLQPSFHPLVWVAANDLPLHEALIPFLLARSGQRLKEFIRWVIHVRPPAWLAGVVRSLPEVAAMLPEFKPELSPEDERRVIESVMKFMEGVPGIQNDFIAKGLAQGRDQGLVQGLVQGLAQGRHEGIAPLIRLFTRRLGRALTATEQQTLTDRLSTVGADRLGDVVLDLTPEQLGAWLADPGAR